MYLNLYISLYALKKSLMWILEIYGQADNGNGRVYFAKQVILSRISASILILYLSIF